MLKKQFFKRVFFSVLYKFFHARLFDVHVPFGSSTVINPEEESRVAFLHGETTDRTSQHRRACSRLDLSAAVWNGAPEEFASQPSVLGTGRL